MNEPLRKPDASPANIFDEIRTGFRFVAAHAAHVHIREDRLAAYALSLSPRPPANALDSTHHFTSADPEDLAAYILTLDAVNFGSGYEDDLLREGWNRIDNSLYFTIATALKTAFETAGPWRAQTLRTATPDRMRTIFRLPAARMGNLLAEQFSLSLNELGGVLETACGGSFLALLKSADGRAGNLVSRLAAIPGFADIVPYRGRTIPILKRAQITAADLHLAFSRIGHVLFPDMEHLTAFADNGLPLVLHTDGILEIAPALARRIAARSFIPARSAEETELRCCAAEAVERLAVLKNMRAVDIDHILWHRSVEGPHYKTRPAHRTLTRFY